MTPTRYPSYAQRKQAAKRRDAQMKADVEASEGFTQGEFVRRPVNVYQVPTYVVRCHDHGLIAGPFDDYGPAEAAMVAHYRGQHYDGGTDA